MAQYVARLTSGEYLNKDGTAVADKNVVDIYSDLLDVFVTAGNLAISSGVRQINQLEEVTVGRTFGAVIS